MPSLRDDSGTVTLDLHGATVREAEALADATLREAAARGRSSVTLVHGSSTSSDQYRNRTIKHAVQDLADAHPTVTNALRSQNRLRCSLDVTAAAGDDAAPLTLRDVQ
jgi:DNA-nicking Smr family endonuclease